MTSASLQSRAGDTSDPLTGLSAVVALRRLADTLELQQVQAALDRGYTWPEIADALGVTRQAVHKKHRHRVRTPGGRP